MCTGRLRIVIYQIGRKKRRDFEVLLSKMNGEDRNEGAIKWSRIFWNDYKTLIRCLAHLEKNDGFPETEILKKNNHIFST